MEKSVNWTDYIPTVRTELNKIRKNELPKNINEYTYPIPQNLKLIEDEKNLKSEKDSKSEKKEQLYKKIKPKFKIGRYV